MISNKLEDKFQDWSVHHQQGKNFGFPTTFVAHHDKSFIRGEDLLLLFVFLFLNDSQKKKILLCCLILNVLTIEAGSKEHCLVGLVKQTVGGNFEGKDSELCAGIFCR